MPLLGVIASSTRQGLSTTSFESIATTTVGSGGSSTVTFDTTGLGSTYKHLQIRGILRNAASGSGSLELYMRFNADTGTNYKAYKVLYGDGSSIGAAAAGTSTAATDHIAPSYFVNDGTTASIYNGFICDILDFADTNKYKVTRSLDGNDQNGSGRLNFFSGLWKNTSAITEIKLTVEGGNNFKQYTQFALYGIK